LGEFLGITIDPTSLANPIGSRKQSKFRITAWDRFACRVITSRTADAYGYRVDQ
jgi:hypothetical protein